MAALSTGSFNLPNHLVPGVWKKAQQGSVLAALSQADPQLFGTNAYMTLTAPPKGEVVGEADQKGESTATFAPVTAVPRKVHVTQRFSNEVLWADEDYQIGVLNAMVEASGVALGRALDLIAIHGVNPKNGVALVGNPAKILNTTNATEVGASTLPDADLEDALGKVIADGVMPNGIALDPAFAFKLATQKDDLGRRLFPELGYGTGMTNFGGLRVAVSDTVSAPEAAIVGGAYATDNPNVKAIVGDFSAFRWGIQRAIAMETIQYGDPDGLGDLKRKNQIAIRAEVVYGIGILSTDAFGKIIDDEA